MVDTDNLYYDFAGITNIADAINRFCSDMDQQLGDVESTFNNLIANGWSGAGADQFGIQQKKWHTNAADLKATLQLLGTKVGNAAFHMNDADNRAANRIASS
jgi:WXG100 family type VII secretion target